MALLISALIFLFVVILASLLLRPWLAVSHKRIDHYLISPSLQAWDTRGDARPSFTDRVLLPALRTLGQALMGITPSGVLAKIRQKLDMAGNPRHFGAVEYLGTKVLSVALVIPLGLLGLRYVPLPGIIIWVAIGVVIGVGIWLPDIILQRIIETRQNTIRRTLPDALDLLVVSVEAGIGFDGAVQKVVEKTAGPLKTELARVLEQIRLGKSRSEALHDMGRRTDVSDLISFVAAITQADILGISIAKLLRTQANTARERRAQRARDTASQLPVKLLFPLVFFIFPSLFVVILGPGLVRFAELIKVLNN
ncbi:MAG TPA: type II secretion system F family protein [Armatimonadota bacterium]|jgi:tight adherence protein C